VGRTAHTRGLIDTDILIDASRGVAAAGAFLNQAQAETGVIISVISAMELVRGCRDKRQLADVTMLIHSSRVLPVTSRVSILALAFLEEFALSHGLGLPDALIAATAVRAQMPLYTRNTRHFSMIRGLAVVQPY
jgi:predicted nucleic acid-binding protein